MVGGTGILGGGGAIWVLFASLPAKKKIIELSKYGRNFKQFLLFSLFSPFLSYFSLFLLFSFPFFFPSFKVLGEDNFPSKSGGTCSLYPPEYAPVSFPGFRTRFRDYHLPHLHQWWSAPLL